ncbi:MAG: bifunctional methylenetetrahydrofolate dehydrogenase/methenyltetrahydrofolate cyclohydrolase FolD [Anaerolineae bacterium]|nr:bifunctional methylenetetrahydrofolate dehydrogenase/methenyltetrahydrofolate cyclohydrolase FolD [Anaerolineae bacterium]
MTQLIDGVSIAAQIRAEVKEEVAEMKHTLGITPGLATLLVGDDPASATYVRSKHKACEEAGIASFGHVLPHDATQEQVAAVLTDLANDPKVHGILMQLPLPKHLNEDPLLALVPQHKDVDGFHPSNLGMLGVKGKKAAFAACTPAGCIELLDRTGVKIAGKRAVVLGRSTIVGLPVSLMLLARDATVTICHSRTANLAEVVREADIVIAAIGKPLFVTADMVKPGAVVIDVGINRISDPSRKSGSRLVGDVDFDAVAPIASSITPVPGGVGPMTIALLMKNTLKAAKQSLK